jgi:hypothetical protein
MASLINQNWVFGQRARLDFSTSIPTVSASTAINTGEGCASISDASGQLLMYTDGQRVWEGGTNTVQATGLLGNPSSTQSAIIVPDPAGPSRYYVFTADGASGGNNHLNGIHVDTATATWTVTPLSALMTMPPTAGLSSTEKVTAIQHRNCRDFWVLTVVQPGAGPANLRVFLVSAAGVQHVSDTPMQAAVHDLGYLKGSGDGKRIALANWGNRNVLVYPFDNVTGTLDVPNRQDISVPAIPGVDNHPRLVYGVEFSPKGDLLYYSIVGGNGSGPTDRGYVFQHDLTATTGSVQVGMHPNAGGRYSLGALQLGMDGRIYIAQDQESVLGVIGSPDAAGSLCNLAFGALALPPGAVCYMGLPNLIPNACGCACEEGPCDAAVEDANHELDEQASKKHFTIPAVGQRPPGRCGLAFEQREFAPQFSLHWGDGAADQFESHDTEIIYIRVWNPFRNLLYRGVKIFNIRVTPNQTLPDGTDALALVPAEIVCFDEIGPCTSIARDFAFLIQNAVPQGYQITFEYCIEETVIVGGDEGRAAFDIQVVAS